MVVPVHNEAPNIAPLLAEIGAALDPLLDYEIIYVDDGSTDETLAELRRAARALPRLRVLRHERSHGQSTAILSGVRAARAPWVATLDGDGQNDPADIPRLLSTLHGSNPPSSPHLVTGWRQARRDSALTRLSSRVANAVRGTLLGDRAPDTGCGLKVFRRETYLALPYFDHMHRFLPALMQRAGAGVVSVPVRHRPRTRGRSHYGVHNRLWTGLVDLAGVLWLMHRARRPVVTEDVRDEHARAEVDAIENVVARQ